MRLRFVPLLVLMPACGSILGVESLDVRDTVTDAGAKHDAAITDAGLAAITPIEGGAGDANVAAPLAVLPPEGTYHYVTSGTEHVKGSFFDEPATYGPDATIQVTKTSDTCVSWAIAPRNNYTDTMEAICLTGPALVQSMEHRVQNFAAGNADTTETCTPGDLYFHTAPEKGEQWEHECTGSNTAQSSKGNPPSAFTVSGTYTFVGPETIPINGKDVPVSHFAQVLTVGGSQTGSNIADWWLSTTTGLLVKLVRKINISYDAGGFIGNVTYTEDLSMTLNQLPPQL